MPVDIRVSISLKTATLHLSGLGGKEHRFPNEKCYFSVLNCRIRYGRLAIYRRE
jgi:hypothetical protein